MGDKTQKLKAIIIGLLIALPCLGLIALYGAGLLADHHYYFDLLGHFVLQYMIAALILCIFAALCRQVKWAFVMVAFALVCFAHSRMALHDPFQFTKPPPPQNGLTIASWNQNIHNMSMENMAGLFFAGAAPPDVIIILEANGNTLKMADSMIEGYPHQINGIAKRPNRRPMSFLVMSRLPVLDQATIPLHVFDWNNEVLRFSVQPTSAPQPYVIYAVHTHSPSNEPHQKRRNHELERLAAILEQDDAPHIIIAGDLNTTPYIPAFRDFLSATDLNYQSYGAFLSPSWPVEGRYAALRVPIDHMLYSDGLTQHNKNVVALKGSDHLALIAQFSQK